MNGFDSAIIAFFNQFSQESKMIDWALSTLSGDNFFKCTLPIVLYWVAWNRKEDPIRREETRRRIVSAFVAAFAAMASARLLALMLPGRLRPIHNPELPFRLPYGMTTDVLDGWSSFPSDHASLFFALAVGLLSVSRGLGLLSLLHVIFIVSLPRIYLGLHYPTDILGGAVLGTMCALLAGGTLVKTRVSAPLLRMIEKYPMISFPLIYLATYQLNDLFDGSRALAHVFLAVLKGQVEQVIVR